MLRDSKHALRRWAAVGLLLIGAAIVIAGGPTSSPFGSLALAQQPNANKEASEIDLTYVSDGRAQS